VRASRKYAPTKEPLIAKCNSDRVGMRKRSVREGERERDGDWVIKNHNITKQNKTKASDFCFSLVVLGSVCMCGFLLIISLSLFWPYLSPFFVLQFCEWPQFMQICRNHNSICTISSIKNRWRGQEHYIVVKLSSSRVQFHPLLCVACSALLFLICLFLVAEFLVTNRI